MAQAYSMVLMPVWPQQDHPPDLVDGEASPHLETGEGGWQGRLHCISDLGHERERLTQIITVLAVSACGFEKIEAECEVSGVTKILLKAYLMLPPECRVSSLWPVNTIIIICA